VCSFVFIVRSPVGGARAPFVVKNCLVKSKLCRPPAWLSVRDFNYLRFAGAVTRNRRVKVSPRLSDTCSASLIRVAAEVTCA